jgi:hypothetical protein
VSVSPHQAARIRAEQAIARYRAELVREFGWTELELEVRTNAAGIALAGQVLLGRVARRLLVQLGTDIACDIACDIARDIDCDIACDIDCKALRVREPLGWFKLAAHNVEGGAVGLVRRRGGTDVHVWLADHFASHSEPLEVVVTVGEDRLVRGRDGTVGWTRQPFTIASGPPGELFASDDPHAAMAVARDHLGVRYRLGGSTREGIDCSALVQNAVRLGLGGVIPRHSGDQLDLGSQPGPGENVGDLVFVWGQSEPACHVGIASERRTVVHASRSRQCVVEDALASFTAGARTIRHVPYARVLDRCATNLGRVDLDRYAPPP